MYFYYDNKPVVQNNKINPEVKEFFEYYLQEYRAFFKELSPHFEKVNKRICISLMDQYFNELLNLYNEYGDDLFPLIEQMNNGTFVFSENSTELEKKFHKTILINDRFNKIISLDKTGSLSDLLNQKIDVFNTKLTVLRLVKQQREEQESRDVSDDIFQEFKTLLEDFFQERFEIETSENIALKEAVNNFTRETVENPDLFKGDAKKAYEHVQKFKKIQNFADKHQSQTLVNEYHRANKEFQSKMINFQMQKKLMDNIIYDNKFYKVTNGDLAEKQFSFEFDSNSQQITAQNSQFTGYLEYTIGLDQSVSSKPIIANQLPIIDSKSAFIVATLYQAELKRGLIFSSSLDKDLVNQISDIDEAFGKSLSETQLKNTKINIFSSKEFNVDQVKELFAAKGYVLINHVRFESALPIAIDLALDCSTGKHYKLSPGRFDYDRYEKRNDVEMSKAMQEGTRSSILHKVPTVLHSK